MRTYIADLHIHTALSPCASEEMSPPAVVEAARMAGLHLIAICDHNTAGNARATQTAAGGALTVLAGMEITTAEEVHVVGLFPDAAAAEAAADAVGATLPAGDDEYFARFGVQRRMDAAGQVVSLETRMLAQASTLALTEAVALIHRHGGLAVAAHVNRPSFSVLSQLGVFPEDAGFDAIEVFTPCGGAVRGPATNGARGAAAALGSAANLPVLASSDAHFPAEVGRCRSQCEMEQASFAELARALRGAAGRRIWCA